MRFASPSYLWLVLFIPVLFAYYVWEAKKNQKLLSHWIAKNLWSKMIPEYRSQSVKKGLSVLGCFFLILALARPQFGSHEELLQSTGLDIFIVLDVSTSMNVEDVVPSRIQAAKHMIRSIVENSQGNRMGVVAFAGSAYVASPLTNDLNYFLKTIDLLSPKTIQNQGTDIGSALITASQALDRGGEENVKEIPSHVLILISDGEDLEGEALKASEELKKKGIKFYALGVGTEKGGPIPLKDSNGNLQTFKKNSKGQPITSTFSPRALSQIAEKAGGKYWTVTPGEPELQELLKDLNQLSRGEFAERRYQVQEERYQIPLFIALLVLILSLSMSKKKNLLCSIIFFFSSDLWAATSLDSYLQNKRGMEALQAGDLAEAERSFGAAQALSPSSPELRFNQGVVEFSSGRLEEAIKSFEDANQKAEKDLLLKSKAKYNLGHVFTEQEKISDAVHAYAEAIQLAQKISDPVLEAKARKNLELLIRRPKEDQKKKNQKQDPDKNKDQDPSEGKRDQSDKNSKKNSKDKNSDGQQEKKDSDQDKTDSKEDDPKASEKSKDKKEKNADQESDKNSTESSNDQLKDGLQTPSRSEKKEFRSEKMKSEDAERVMAELTNREKELQEKLHTKNANGKNRSSQRSKDW